MGLTTTMYVVGTALSLTLGIGLSQHSTLSLGCVYLILALDSTHTRTVTESRVRSGLATPA